VADGEDLAWFRRRWERFLRNTGLNPFPPFDGDSVFDPRTGEWFPLFGDTAWSSVKVSWQMDESPQPQPEPEEEHPRVVVHVRFRQSERGFSWTFTGDDCVERAKSMVEWARGNQHEWVQVESDTDETWYPLREISRIEMRSYGVKLNEVQDELSEDEQIELFRQQLDRWQGGDPSNE
jgi:hypothetical protein